MDKKNLIKALLMGFIPIIAYIIVEAEYGPEWGMAAAFAWSLGEMALIYWREKRWEKILLFDIGLIGALGTVSLILHDDFFFKLKPAVFEAVFLVVIALSLWGNIPIIQSMSARQFKRSGIKVDTDNAAFVKMLKGMFFLLLFHIFAVVWAALYASTEMWGFVSGGLLYILFGVWAAGQILPKFIHPFYWKIRYADDEWLPVLNPDNGALLFNAPRSVVHTKGDWLHPVVHVNVFNSNGEWYLQKRLAAKRTFPGYWDVSVGGHIEAGEDIVSAAEREALEEIGLKLSIKGRPDYIYQLKSGEDRELVHVFLLKTDEEPEPNPEELSEGRFWSLKEVKENLDEDVFTPAVRVEFQLLSEIFADKYQKSETKMSFGKKRKKKRKR